MTLPCLTILLAALALGLSGCGYTPEQLGVTGPGTGQVAVPSHASETDQDATLSMPGLPSDFGARYAPAIVPSYGPNGRFYGYN